jgi:hypothetical protein
MRESIDSGCEKPATCLVLRLITISLPSLGLLRTLLERGTWLPGMGLRKTKNADIFKNYVCTRRCALVGAVFWSKKRTLQTDRHSCDTPVCQWLMVECNEFVCWKTKKSNCISSDVNIVFLLVILDCHTGAGHGSQLQFARWPSAFHTNFLPLA